MLIEVGSPASLPLGLVKFNNGQVCLLGLTVQHPPVQLFAQAHPKLQITGARADMAHQRAVRFLQHNRLPQQAEVEIELSIPALAGLGSDTLLGLSMARALSWVHNLPDDRRTTPKFAQALGLSAQQALEIYSFDTGGLLLIDTQPQAGSQLPPLLRRAEISHKEKEAWAFVFYLPNIPAGTPPTLEADRMANLLQAAPHLSAETGALVNDQLWPAVENNNFETFGRSLHRLHQLNLQALEKAGAPLTHSAEEAAILEVMQANGAIAWGQNLTGLLFYGLTHGARPSQILRQKLRQQVGFFGGIIMATITANAGAAEAVKQENLADNKMTPLRIKPPK